MCIIESKCLEIFTLMFRIFFWLCSSCSGVERYDKYRLVHFSVALIKTWLLSPRPLEFCDLDIIDLTELILALEKSNSTCDTCIYSCYTLWN